MLKKNIVVALGIVGLALSAGASAQSTTPYYVGGTVGTASWSVDCAGAANCKTNDTAFKILAGYEINPMWAVEASYFSLGKATASGGNFSGEFKATGVDVAGVLRGDFGNNWGGFAKLGVAEVKGEVNASVGNLSGSTSTNSAQVVAGLGVTYKFSETLRARAEVESRRVKLSDIDGGTGTVRNFSVGLEAKF